MPVRPNPESYQPPLRWWSHAWRVMACLVISGLVWSQAIEGQASDHELLFALDAVVGLLAYGLMFLRRRWPFAIAVVLTALSAVSGVASGPAALATVSLATRRRLVPMLAVGVLGLVTAQIYTDTQPLHVQDPFWLTVTLNTVVTAALLGWGMYIGSRRELLWTLRDRAERAEAEQQLRVLNARSAERSRIAREMHDVLAHRISQVSMHAGALAFRKDLSAEELRVGAGVIQSRANEALNDLRAVLGVLREPQTGELVDAPQPTYDDLEALVDQARETGMNVDFRDRLTGTSSVPLVVGRTVYRMVQEGLTNAHKHAPGALVRIELSGSPEDGIDLVVRNAVGFHPAPAVPGAGLGLIGLSERAELRGGRLGHRREGSVFVLHGWIPWAT